MSDTATLADHIDRQADAILAVWKSSVQRFGDVPDARRLTHREFLDHIPELLDRLADRLRGGDADPIASAQKHGQHRWSQGYDIAELVHELGCLRSVLIRDTFAFARDNDVDLEAVERTMSTINRIFDEATAESVRQFEEDGKSLSRGMLDAFDERRAEADRERIKLQALLGNLPLGVWVAGPDGTITHVNREAERLQGFGEAETVGRVNIYQVPTAYHLFRPDGTPVPPEALPMARALRGETISQEDYTWATSAGTIDITVSAGPLRGEDGSLAGALVVAQDISERKRLEVELKNSELRFRGIFDNSPVMIWRSDRQGRRDLFNKTWLEFRGRAREDEVGDGWTQGVHPDDRARCAEFTRRAFEAREPFELIYKILDREGRYRSVTDRGSPSHDAEGKFLGYLGSCLDISERIEMESRLELQSQHKSRLMSALSHDARTPLNAVVLSAKLLESQVKDQDDPEVRDCLTTIRNAVRNVIDLLSDLLDLSRIDAGATRAEASKFPLRATLEECLSSIEPQARVKGLEVRIDRDGVADVRLETDRAKLKQILSNLLSNALRYTEAGYIRLFTNKVDNRLLIGVEDSGVGIAEADQQRIFDEFAVLEHPNRPRGEGTGLGLAICRRLANLLRGEILLDSAPGKGSTFTLSLPESVINTDPADDDPVDHRPAAGPPGAILIAEDHADSRKTLAKVLRRMGYRALEAGDGHEVLALVREERPMVVLMDVNMPGLDGVETTLALRANPEFQDLPIFALTGDVSIVNQQRIGDAGVDGYLEKPVTWEKLEAALSRLRGRPGPSAG